MYNTLSKNTENGHTVSIVSETCFKGGKKTNLDGKLFYKICDNLTVHSYIFM